MRYLIIFLFLINCSQEQITYLKCGDKFFAFSKQKIFVKWNNIEGKFEDTLNIKEYNKQIVKASFMTTDKEIKVDPKPVQTVTAVGVYIRTYELDRIKGTLSLLDNKKILKIENCEKISKKDLPIKKLKQKF